MLTDVEEGGGGAFHSVPRGHVHRTQIAAGSANPTWDKGFQFGVGKALTNDRLRLQVLHKAAVGTEFIGAVTIEVRTIIDTLSSLATQPPTTPSPTKSGNEKQTSPQTFDPHAPHSGADTSWLAPNMSNGFSNGVSSVASRTGGGGGGGGGGKWKQIALPESESAESTVARLMHARKKLAPPTNVVWGTWMPLRNVVGERARGPSGGDDCQVLLGFRWTCPMSNDVVSIQGLLQEPQGVGDGSAKLGAGSSNELTWTSGRFVLDGPEQMFWMREGAGTVGRKMWLRFAEVHDESMSIGPCVFSVTSAAGSTFIGRALDEADHERWVSALRASAGLKAPPPPEPETTCFQRHRQLVLGGVVVWGGLIAVMVALLIVLSSRSTPDHLFANITGPWDVCSPTTAMPVRQLPESLLQSMALPPGTANASLLLWCIGCDCFSRCVFGYSGGLGLGDPTMAYRACSNACGCLLPPPSVGCGDGLVRTRTTVEWYGQQLDFFEECDDANQENGDGCDRWCRIEKFIMSDVPAMRSVGGVTSSLCGNRHSFSACENACVSSSSCQCLWFGAGYCHLYSSCGAGELIGALSRIETSWDEVEVKCGAGNFVVDPHRQEIRSRIVLFGVKELNETGRTIFGNGFKSFCSPPCFVTVLESSIELLPSLQQQQQLRRLPTSSTSSTSSTSRPPHMPLQPSKDTTLLHGFEAQSPLATSPGARQARDTTAIIAAFKFTVANSTARETLQKLVSFVNAGENGFWGRLRELGLVGIEGVMFHYPNGSPRLMSKPATPQDPGGLFRKVPYQCSEGNRYLSRAASHVQVQNSSLCCGNRSQVCHPQAHPDKANCYISTRRQFQCLPARAPFEPEYVTGVPYDERVHLYWQPPGDAGGHNLTGYRVERVPFEAGQSLAFDAPELTSSTETRWCATGLTNFIPWYFRVSALNILGAGPPSQHSPAYTPWVLPPNPPTNLRAQTGNRRVFLTWEPPAYNGGRPLESFLIEIAHDTYSRTKCSDPHGCVDDVLAHQRLPGHKGLSGLWARQSDPEPSKYALEWGLINAEPLTPDCLDAPVLPAKCPSLLITPAAPGSGGVRLKNGAYSPSREYLISALVPQRDPQRDSVFVPDPPGGIPWMEGMCVTSLGQTVAGMVQLSAALAGTDKDALQSQCEALCMAHQIPSDWRDRLEYVSGYKRGCELVVGEGWSSAGCYLHTSPLVQIANGAALRYCKPLNLWSADRRRKVPIALLASIMGLGLTNTSSPKPFTTSAAAVQPEVEAESDHRHGNETESYGVAEEVAVEEAEVSARGATWRSNAAHAPARRNAADAPVCGLPTAPVLARTVEVLRDAQGNALMNNYRYYLRVRAYNGFQPSLPTANLTVHPVGELSQRVLNLMAECRNSSSPHRCKTGYVGDTRMSVFWDAPFFDDRVTDVLGYLSYTDPRTRARVLLHTTHYTHTHTHTHTYTGIGWRSLRMAVRRGSSIPSPRKMTPVCVSPYVSAPLLCVGK
jgi:cysteine-rich repeat protein